MPDENTTPGESTEAGTQKVTEPKQTSEPNAEPRDYFDGNNQKANEPKKEEEKQPENNEQKFKDRVSGAFSYILSIAEDDSLTDEQVEEAQRKAFARQPDEVKAVLKDKFEPGAFDDPKAKQKEPEKSSEDVAEVAKKAAQEVVEKNEKQKSDEKAKEDEKTDRKDALTKMSELQSLNELESESFDEEHGDNFDKELKKFKDKGFTEVESVGYAFMALGLKTKSEEEKQGDIPTPPSGLKPKAPKTNPLAGIPKQYMTKEERKEMDESEYNI